LLLVWKEETPKELCESSIGAMGNDTGGAALTVVILGHNVLEGNNKWRLEQMETKKVYTVEEVMELLIAGITETYATTPEGQAQLIRVVKAISNESIEKRKATSKQTRGEAAFNKELGKVAAKTPDMVTGFMAGREAWIAKHIARKYDVAE
jgi:hypothetical protein